MECPLYVVSPVRCHRGPDDLFSPGVNRRRCARAGLVWSLIRIVLYDRGRHESRDVGSTGGAREEECECSAWLADVGGNVEDQGDSLREDDRANGQRPTIETAPHGPRGSPPPRRRRASLATALSLTALLGVVAVVSYLSFLPRPGGESPTHTATVTVTVTAAPSGRQVADGSGSSSSNNSSSDGGANYTALIAAIAAMIAGLGTAASGFAAVMALRRKGSS